MKQKSFFKPTIWLLATCVILLSSCKPDPELTVSTNQISFSANGESVSLKVKSNTSWIITGNPSWLTVSPSTGSENANVEFTAQQNSETTSRKCVITISTDDAEVIQTINVEQAGSEVFLSVSPSDISFSANGESVGLKVKSNTSWIITGNPSWLTVSPSTGSENANVVFAAQQNSETTSRKCVITISTDDAEVIQTINVEQAGSEVFLSVSPSDIYFTSKEGESAELKIMTQTTWRISDVPSWLNVNQQGDGTTTIKVTTKSANETDESRSAELKVTAGEKTATVTVTQEAGKPVCYVEPINVVALYDEICFELSATSNVNTFKIGYLDENEYKRMTEKEIIAYVEEGDMNKFADDYIFFPGGFDDNTKYYICTIAYDENGDAGKLRYATITTPQYIDYDNDAFVSLSDLSYGADGFQFTVAKEGFCNTYHLIYGNIGTSDEGYSRSLYAFQIKYFMNKGKKHWFAENWGLDIVTDYPNNHTFSHYTYTIPYFPVIVIYGWGVFKDGSLSSDMIGGQWNTSEYDAPSLSRAERRVSGKNGIFTRVISRSVEEAKAAKMQ